MAAGAGAALLPFLVNARIDSCSEAPTTAHGPWERTRFVKVSSSAAVQSCSSSISCVYAWRIAESFLACNCSGAGVGEVAGNTSGRSGAHGYGAVRHASHFSPLYTWLPRASCFRSSFAGVFGERFSMPDRPWHALCHIFSPPPSHGTGSMQRACAVGESHLGCPTPGAWSRASASLAVLSMLAWPLSL